MPSPGERAKICLVWVMVPVSITLNFVASIVLVNIDHKSIFGRGIPTQHCTPEPSSLDDLTFDCLIRNCSLKCWLVVNI